MIFDKIENAGRYMGMNPNLDRALRFLTETDLSALPEGRTEIDGDKVFVNVMTAETDPDDKRGYEFHEKYYDIQIDIMGAETVCVGTEYRSVIRPYSEEYDVGFGECGCEAECRLSPGRFVVCEPGEPHQPGGAADGKPMQIRKAVVKVHR